MGGKVKATKAIKIKFLDLLERGWTVEEIADELQITGRTFYRARKTDEEFAEAWAKAADTGAKIQLEYAEKEVRRRAIDGWMEPVFYKGEKVGEVRKFSDRLLILRVKALAKRAGDDSYVQRTDITSQGDQVKVGVIVVGETIQDEDAWHDQHSTETSLAKH